MMNLVFVDDDDDDERKMKVNITMRHDIWRNRIRHDDSRWDTMRHWSDTMRDNEAWWNTTRHHETWGDTMRRGATRCDTNETWRDHEPWWDIKYEKVRTHAKAKVMLTPLKVLQACFAVEKHASHAVMHKVHRGVPTIGFWAVWVLSERTNDFKRPKQDHICWEIKCQLMHQNQLIYPCCKAGLFPNAVTSSITNYICQSVQSLQAHFPGMFCKP